MLIKNKINKIDDIIMRYNISDMNLFFSSAIGMHPVLKKQKTAPYLKRDKGNIFYIFLNCFFNQSSSSDIKFSKIQ